MVTATQTESDASLSHHGIKGMRWGVRRFQNKDGSLTNTGKKRYNVDIEDTVTKKQKAKAEARKASARYNRTYSKKDAEALTKANSKLKYANRQVKNEKIKSKLNDETKKSKRRLTLENQYKQSGMTEEEAAIAAYKRVKTEKAIAAISGMTVAAVTAYVAYKNYDKTVDKIIKPGTKIHNISTNSNKGIEDAFYFSQTKMDQAKYKGIYGKALSSYGTNKVYDTQIGINKTIKVASEKSATRALSELVNGDKQYAEQLSKHLESSKNRYASKSQNDLISKAATKLSKGKIDADVYNALNLTLVDHQLPTSSSINKGFYDKLKSKGYDAIIDINDKKYSGYKSSKPVIGFNMAGKATVDKISEVGKQEIEKNYKIGMADLSTKAYAPAIAAGAAYVMGIKKVSDTQTKKKETQIVNEYRKKHPKSNLSNTEILNNYYDY